LKSKDLKNLNLKSVYRTGSDDLLNDFYIPSLSVARNYDRAVGYFSTSLVAYALKGISSIVRNNGMMRLIVGFPLSEEELTAAKKGKNKNYYDDLLVQSMIELFESVDLKIEKERLSLFSFLIATGKLKLKFAFKTRGMYHEKIGIIYDNNGNKVLFHGSANETTNAIHPDLNFESVAIYKSWNKEVYQEYATEFEKGFERLWRNEEKSIHCVDMPSTLYEKIVSNYSKNHNIDIDKLDEKSWQEELNKVTSFHYPSIPKEIKGNPFSIYNHQKLALSNWFDNNMHGLFKLATGSGKTITAMYGIAKIFEAARKPRMMCVIVSVPYVALAEQWCEELGLFGMEPVKCFNSSSNWQHKLSASINNLLLGNTEFISIVVVNKTLRESDIFREYVNRIPYEALFFVGDECHRHGTQKMYDALPNAKFRIGLSATPYIEDDDYLERNTEKMLLTSYYGDIVAEYTLEDALNNNVLTPYKYQIIEVYLTENENEEYIKLSKEIGRQMNIDNSLNNTRLANAIRERNKIVQNANNKSNVLKDLLKHNENNDKAHTLFYVGEGSSNEDTDKSELERIAIALRDKGWKVSRFTSKENSKDRKVIMDSFKEQEIDALVSMKVLDEGIDIPQCNTAYILASSSNSRQFIQRRGRILRRHPNKKQALIYDFVVLPNPNSDFSSVKSLVVRELKRVMDFVKPSMNRYECQKMAESIATKFDIEMNEF